MGNTIHQNPKECWKIDTRKSMDFFSKKDGSGHNPGTEGQSPLPVRTPMPGGPWAQYIRSGPVGARGVLEV
jgi:hypothetical protein